MSRRRHAAATKQPNTKLFYGILAVLAIVGIGAIIYAMTGGGGAGATQPLELTVDDPQELVRQARGVAVGETNAPLRMLVFSDYMCPGCGHWATAVEPQVKRDFVDTGRLQLVYHDFPLPNHPYSFVAARAARCAEDQGRFWEYHDQLFQNQQEWSFTRGEPIAEFREYAERIELDTGEFQECLGSVRHADLVTANRLLGDNLRVTGTPTVFVNGRQLVEWQDYAAVKAELERQMSPGT